MRVPMLFVSLAAALVAAGPIAGLVVDTSGAAVADAAVCVVVNGTCAITTKTTADGRFTIGDAPADGIVLRVTSPGFGDAELRVAADALDEPITVTLQPAGLFTTVTVTASRAPEQLATPAASTVLTSAALATTAAPTIDDTLRNTTGFGLMRRSSSRVANPSSQGVTFRGLEGNAGSRTLVLADGRPLNDAFGGWVYWNRVPEAAIDRVEVVRGATGDLYGGDALGGVVQLLTFSPAKPRLRATADGGSARTFKASVFGGGQRDGWNTALGGERVRTDGEMTIAEDQRGPVDVPAASDYGTWFAGGGYDSGTWRLHARASIYQEDRSNGTVLVTNNTDWRLFSLDAAGQAAGGLWSAQASSGHQDYFNNFSSIPPDRQTERLTSEQRVPSWFTNGSVQWMRPVQRHVLLFGAEIKQTAASVNEIRFSPVGPPSGPFVTGGTERAGSVYARASLAPTTRLVVVTGIRGDMWHSTPTETDAPSHAFTFFSPRLSMSWQATPAIAIRASATHAYRTPTLDELHRSSRVGNTLVMSNALLDPESLMALDAGVLITRARGSARVTAFWNDMTDAITNVTLSSVPSLVTQQKQNADNVRAYGVEMEADLRLGTLALSGGVTVTSSRFRNEVQKPALEGNRVPQVPVTLANASATWTGLAGITASAQLRGSSGQFEDDLNTLPLDSYAVVDAYASRAVTRAIQVYGACENVFDTEYQTGKIGNPPVTRVGWPRTFRIGLRLALP